MDGEVLAVHDICTHALESLSGGWVEGDRIECPRHGASFSLRYRRGARRRPPSAPLPTFAVEVRDGRVLIDPTPSRAHPADPLETRSYVPEPILQIEGLEVAVDDTPILKGVDLAVPQGEVHALMGPNGSGKSTLAYALAGHPRYDITAGSARFDGQDIAEMEADERARLGLFLAMQYPVEVPGVSVMNFLRTSLNAIHGEEISPRDFVKLFDAEVEAARLRPRLRRPLPERGLLRRREEAPRDPADGDARAALRRSSTRPTRASTWTR